MIDTKVDKWMIESPHTDSWFQVWLIKFEVALWREEVLWFWPWIQIRSRFFYFFDDSGSVFRFSNKWILNTSSGERIQSGQIEAARMKGGCGIGSRSEGAPPFTFHINSLHTKFIQFACSVRTNSEKRASDPRLSSPSSPSLSLLGKRGSLFNFQPFLLLSLSLSFFTLSLSLSLFLQDGWGGWPTGNGKN